LLAHLMRIPVFEYCENASGIRLFLVAVKVTGTGPCALVAVVRRDEPHLSVSKAHNASWGLFGDSRVHDGTKQLRSRNGRP